MSQTDTTSAPTTKTSTAEPPPSQGNLYWRLWLRTPRELGFLLIGFPIALAGFVVTISLFNTGVGTIVTFFLGVVLLIAALYVSRAFSVLELTRLDWAKQPPIPRHDWQAARARTGFWGWLRSVLGNGHYWLALLHTMVINFAVSLITWTITVTWLALGLGGVTYSLWAETGITTKGHRLFWLFGNHIEPAWAAPVVYFLIGIIALGTLPFITRGLTTLHWGIARGVIGAWRSEALQAQVKDLSESRVAASSAEGHSLRRLERDIHDGPQQRLVRMQMDLAAADRQLDTDPERARGLIAEALQQSKDALEELRALSRGFAPPILLDRGLVAALQSAAIRSSVPATVTSELSNDLRVPQEVERNAYFVASEALTNAAKHSGASAVAITVASRVEGGSTIWLDLSVTDDGTGGALVEAGHGLAGLQERLRGAGGTLEVSSPAGGPTVIAAHFPLANGEGTVAPTLGE